MDKLKNSLLKGANIFQSNAYVKAITSAMMGLMSIMMVSSIVSLVNAIDIGSSKAFMESVGITAVLKIINVMTIDIVSVYVAFLVGYKLGEIKEHDSLTSGIMGLMTFLILTPLSVGEGFNGLALSSLGSTGMFVAMIGGLLGATIYMFFVNKNWMIKMPEQVPPSVSKSFAAIIPALMVALVAALITVGMANTEYGSLSAVVYKIVQAPLNALGANIFAAMFIVAFIELLWFFGIHGVLAVYPILMLLFYEPQMANLAAYGAGLPLPYLFTMGFVLNNRGARSFAVSILCIFTTKSERLKAVGKIGLIPAFFSISEPIKFGIPQVMNLRMLPPLLLTPAASVLVAYILTIIGFLPYHNGVSIPTAFPIIFNGFLFNGWQGIVSQLLQLVVCVLIYIPFIKSQDKEYTQDEINVELAKEKEMVNA